jgi:hypothetical protein
MKKGWKEVEIDMDKDTLLSLALEAHEKDITLNKLVNLKLINYINEMDKKLKKEKTK